MNSAMESADVRHLLSRAGFGFSPQNVLLVSGKDKKKVLKHIFAESKKLQLFTEIPSPKEPVRIMDKTEMAPAEVRKLNQEKQKQMHQEIDSMNIQWLKQMQESVFGLREKMTLFWHGHFACRVPNSYYMQQYYNDVMLMTFSEFGRRVAENASGGTDHGTANNVFVIGGSLQKKGIYNKAPDLTFLQDGDLKHDIDFRQVYTTLLTNWMGVNGDKILGRKFETLGFA